MALPEYSLKQLLESGVHFGHQTHRWNPLMEEYIYGVRNGIHIIDLTQTFSLLDSALNCVYNTVSKGGSVLFVGTKRQAQKPIAEAAERSAQYYMNHRWLGGTLTNWKTVSNSISRLKKLDEQLSDGATGLTKKERLNLEREQTKLNASLGGIREMGGLPDLLFVIDSNKESLSIQEAKNLGIPVIAILDTNSDPTNIDFPVPGNDDAARSISLYCDLIAKSALEGMTNQLASAGVDIGEKEENSNEVILTPEIKQAEKIQKEKKQEETDTDLPNLGNKLEKKNEEVNLEEKIEEVLPVESKLDEIEDNTKDKVLTDSKESLGSKGSSIKKQATNSKTQVPKEKTAGKIKNEISSTKEIDKKEEIEVVADTKKVTKITKPDAKKELTKSKKSSSTVSKKKI